MQAAGRESVANFREVLLQGHPEMLLATPGIVQPSGRPDAGRFECDQQATGSAGDLTADKR